MSPMQGDETTAWMAEHRERGDELLAEIDEHLERGIGDVSSGHLERGAQLSTRLAAHIARWEGFRIGESDPHENWRYSLRRDGLRTEQAFGGLSQSLVRRTHEFVRYFVDEGQAHRDALAKVVDNLVPDDALAAAQADTAGCPLGQATVGLTVVYAGP